MLCLPSSYLLPTTEAMHDGWPVGAPIAASTDGSQAIFWNVDRCLITVRGKARV